MLGPWNAGTVGMGGNVVAHASLFMASCTQPSLPEKHLNRPTHPSRGPYVSSTNLNPSEAQVFGILCQKEGRQAGRSSLLKAFIAFEENDMKTEPGVALGLSLACL